MGVKTPGTAGYLNCRKLDYAKVMIFERSIYLEMVARKLHDKGLALLEGQGIIVALKGA